MPLRRAAMAWMSLAVAVTSPGARAQEAEQDKAQFERVFAVNVTGAMLMGRAAARHFVERDKGVIVKGASGIPVRTLVNLAFEYAEGKS